MERNDQNNQEKIRQSLMNLIVRDRRILLDSTALEQALTKDGLSGTEIHKILLMTNVSGFRDLVHHAPGVRQHEIELYISNALLETGLRKDTILAMTAEFLLPLGVRDQWQISREEGEHTRPAYVIPADTYQAVLEPYEQHFCCIQDETNPKTVPDYEELMPYVLAGLPAAQLYMGAYLLQREDTENSHAFALQILKQAEQAGESRACTVLGSFYLENKQYYDPAKSYEYFTKTGGAVLQPKQLAKYRKLLETKKENRRRVQRGFFLWMLLHILTVLLCWYMGTEILNGALISIFAVGILYLVSQCVRIARKAFTQAAYIPMTLYGLWFVEMLLYGFGG